MNALYLVEVCLIAGHADIELTGCFLSHFISQISDGLYNHAFLIRIRVEETSALIG